MFRYLLIINALFLLLGCNTKKDTIIDLTKTTKIDSEKYFCKEKRSKICPMIYLPVCGKPTNKTYSNGCIACSDNKVQYYVKGKCSN